jgi:MFS transporter, DHA2 family, multidrug resistance protein
MTDLTVDAVDPAASPGTAAPTAPATESVAPRRAGRREWAGLAVLSLACLLYVMDLTVLHLAVPSISRDLRPTSAELLWIIDIYGFMVAGFLVTMGTLGDRIGRRRLLLVGGAAFGALSILAAFSTSPGMLIVSRALLGIAGATIAPSTLSLIFAMFEDPKQRATAIGVWISAFSAGSAIGPVLGGVLLAQFWWGSVFLLALPVMALLLVLGPRVLPEFRDPNAGRLDLVSAALLIVAVLTVIFGVKQIAQDGVGVVALISVAIGLAVGALWVRRQLTAADPMIDLRLIRIPQFSASLAVNFLAVFVLIGYFLFVAQFLQLVLGLSPFEAGLWSLPSAIGFIVGSNVAPRIVRRVRPAYLMAVGLVVGAAGLLLLTQIGTSNSLFVLVAASILISLGLAPVFGLTTDLIVGSAPPERAGAASGMSETFFELGGALGISLLGSVGVAIYRDGIADRLPASVPGAAADAARDTLGAAVAAAGQLPAQVGDALLAVARESFVDGMQLVAAIGVVVAIGVAALVYMTLRDVPPTGEEPAEEVRPMAVPRKVTQATWYCG